MKNRTDQCIAIALFLVSLSVSSYVALALPGTFTSPDEAANAFFAQKLSRTGSFVEKLPDDIKQFTIVHPRSVVIRDGALLPQSFLGLPLYAGGFGKIVGSRNVVFFTPMLAALAVSCFFFLVRLVFSRPVAMMSALFLMIHPAFLYYANRGMFHNVGFVAVLLVAALLLIRGLSARKQFVLSFGGLLLGVALSFRPSEGIWVAVTLGIAWLLFRKNIPTRSALFVMGCTAIGLLPLLVAQFLLYGSPWNFGYAVSTTDTATGTDGMKWAAFIFPFGVHLIKSALEAWRYLMKIFFWLSLPMLIGVFFTVSNLVHQRLLREKINRGILCWLLISFFVILWLGTVYGSWDFYEFSGSSDVTIGSSYARYWLPIYALLTPMAAVFVLWVGKPLRKQTKIIFIAALILGVTTLSFSAVFSDPLYGLGALIQNGKKSEVLSQKIEAAVPKNAVIVSGTADKILFPQFSVISAIDYSDKTDREELAGISKVRPVFLLENVLENPVINNVDEARRYGFFFTQQASIQPSLTLWKLESMPK